LNQGRGGIDQKEAVVENVWCFGETVGRLSVPQKRVVRGAWDRHWTRATGEEGGTTGGGKKKTRGCSVWWCGETRRSKKTFKSWAALTRELGKGGGGPRKREGGNAEKGGGSGTSSTVAVGFSDEN